jgi:hypothetical protein
LMHTPDATRPTHALTVWDKLDTQRPFITNGRSAAPRASYRVKAYLAIVDIRHQWRDPKGGFLCGVNF